MLEEAGALFREALQACREAQWVIEATPDDLRSKQKLFESLESVESVESYALSPSSQHWPRGTNASSRPAGMPGRRQKGAQKRPETSTILDPGASISGRPPLAVAPRGTAGRLEQDEEGLLHELVKEHPAVEDLDLVTQTKRRPTQGHKGGSGTASSGKSMCT